MDALPRCALSPGRTALRYAAHDPPVAVRYDPVSPELQRTRKQMQQSRRSRLTEDVRARGWEALVFGSRGVPAGLSMCLVFWVFWVVFALVLSSSSSRRGRVSAAGLLIYWSSLGLLV